MRMKPCIGVAPLVVLGLAACGGEAGRVSIRGDFADSARAPTAVRAVEAQREVEVKGGAFELSDLSAGPATLRLVRGADTSATLALDNAPAGATVVMHGLRTDARSGRAFPRSIDLTGTEMLVVNGVRMAGDDALPADVDAHGAILALSDERDAFLLRPDDAALPDLRVVVGLGTRVVGPDSAAAEAASLSRGDSVRVVGRTDHGFVVAERIVVPRAEATASSDAPSSSPPATAAEAREAPPISPPTPTVSPSALRRVGPAPRREPRGRGHGRGGGHGRGKGRKG